MPSSTHQNAALDAAKAKLSPEDRQALLSAFVRSVMASTLAVTMSTKKGGMPEVESLSAFKDPPLLRAVSLLLAGTLGASAAESLSIESTIRTTTTEMLRLAAEDSDAFTDMLTEIITTASGSFLS